MTLASINLSSLIASAFFALWKDVREHGHMNYWLKGGRGSTKSSFISLAIVVLVVKYPWANAVIVRKVSNTLRDSVYVQVEWAIVALGLQEFFRFHKSPLEIVYIPTGQRILFRGLDDPLKMKGIKFSKGYGALIWFEELDQFANMEEVRNVLNSVRRGGDKFWCFYSYNPPKTPWSWVNREALAREQRPDTLVHHSTYLDIIEDHPEWIGQPFIDEAEYVKETNEKAYNWEYLGEVTGTGGSVFENLVTREISDEEILYFERHHYGVDFGWFPDPWRFIRSEWQPSARRIIVYGEDGGNKLLPQDQAEIIKKRLTYADPTEIEPTFHRTPVWCDGADDTSIRIYRRDYGINARAARKGNMRNQSYLWLAGLREIVIDPIRCPNTYEELALCEYKKDNLGEWIEDFNDGNDHSIDALRYAYMEEAIMGTTQESKPYVSPFGM